MLLLLNQKTQSGLGLLQIQIGGPGSLYYSVVPFPVLLLNQETQRFPETQGVVATV